MKKVSFLMILTLLLSCFSCQDELQDTIYDHAFFGPYDGNDVRFLDMYFDETKNSDGYYTCYYHIMTYLPQWPDGERQLRYSKDHLFEQDSCFIIAPITSTSLMLQCSYLFRGAYFVPGDKYYFRACYLTKNGDMFYSDEATFYPK